MDDITTLELTPSQVFVLRELVDDSIYEVEHYGRLLNGAAVGASDQERIVAELRQVFESLSVALGIARDRSRSERGNGNSPPYR